MLTNKAVEALSKLGTLSDARLKKKLGPDLFQVVQEPEVKKALAQMKMKQIGADVIGPDAQILPPGILLLIQTLGPILLKFILKRLGIELPTTVK